MSDNKKSGFINNNLPWFLFISVAINIYLLVWIIYRQREDVVSLGDLISISSGLISIALAIVAIIYSISESIKNSNKEKELNAIISKVNYGVTNAQGILKKINSGVEDTQDVLINLNSVTPNINSQIEKMSIQFNELQDTITIIKQQYESEIIMKEVDNDEENIQIDEEQIDNKNIYGNAVSEDASQYSCKEIHSSDKIDKSEHIQTFCKGDIFIAKLDDSDERPVVIVQNNVANRYSSTVIVLPISSKLHAAKLPTHIKINKDESIFEDDSIIIAEQIRTLDKKNLIRYIGSLKESSMLKIDKALQISLNMF